MVDMGDMFGYNCIRISEMEKVDMKVIIKDGKPDSVNLDEKDFMCEGGEGKIYGKGSTIYKIYSDPAKMISPAKIDELKVLASPNILAPKNIILDTKGNPLGFTMDWVKDTIALCKLFTNDFRSRFNVTDDMIVKLVENMRKEISFVHGKGAYLQVDGNEMNYLVDSKDFVTPKLIDVDSFKTPSFPPTALMASIKDHHTQGFSELTDWFAYAVVVTQLFVGIHPFKGTHPNFKKFDMEGRMKANVSIFNKDVRLPSTVRDVNNIPSNYREWLARIFEKGERSLPPGVMGNIIAVAAHVASIGSNQFDISLIHEFASDIYRCKDGYVFLKDKITHNKIDYVSHHPSTEIIHTVPYHKPVKVWLESAAIQLETFEGKKLVCAIPAEDKMVIGDSVFVKHAGKLVEYQAMNMGTNVNVAPVFSIDVMPNATKLFNQIVYQDILGLPVFMLFGKAANNKTVCYQYRMPELAGYQVLEAKYENGIAIIVTSKNGKFDTHTIKFAKDNVKYLIYRDDDTGYYVPNFTVLENGICVSITADDEVHIFSNAISGNIDPRYGMRVIKDPAISFDMKLCHEGMSIMYRRGKKLYKLSMKK